MYETLFTEFLRDGYNEEQAASLASMGLQEALDDHADKCQEDDMYERHGL